MILQYSIYFRLRYYKKLAENVEALKTMRRKINISAANGRSPRDPKHSEAFTKWLEKKEEELEEMAEEDDSGESINKEEEEEDQMYEFNKRVRKQNRPKTRSLTPGNRPVKDIINIGSTTAGDSSNPSPYLHSGAYWEWKRDRCRKSGKRSRRFADIEEEKRRLEERRQKLLLSAISYEEWLDHAEDRKLLIQQILQADSAEMERIEKGKLEDKERRIRMYSYDVWTKQIKERNIEEKKRMEKQRRYEAEMAFGKLQLGKGSAAVEFEIWSQRKRLEMQKEKEKSFSHAKQGQKPRPDPAEVASAYDTWLVKKHDEEMAAIEGKMGQNRMTVVTS